MKLKTKLLNRGSIAAIARTEEDRRMHRTSGQLAELLAPPRSGKSYILGTGTLTHDLSKPALVVPARTKHLIAQAAKASLRGKV